MVSGHVYSYRALICVFGNLFHGPPGLGFTVTSLWFSGTYREPPPGVTRYGKETNTRFFFQSPYLPNI